MTKEVYEPRAPGLGTREGYRDHEAEAKALDTPNGVVCVCPRCRLLQVVIVGYRQTQYRQCWNCKQPFDTEHNLAFLPPPLSESLKDAMREMHEINRGDGE